MNDKLTGCDIEGLLHWILAEEKSGFVLGIHRDLFFHPSPDDPFRLKRYNQELETPIGVAAGPHSQLSQNIIAAWLAGARTMELKTVQVLDELSVTKPCIEMRDEGYNCEWSQELTLADSYTEYLKAWILLHVLRHRFTGKTTGDPGFMFNMSVGYNLEGILSPTVQQFLDRMTNGAGEMEATLSRLAEIYPEITTIDIPARISDNITISTMHGCPPEEIEQIGRYFIEERRLHTTIKLNPTLLGPERLRDILNTRLGFDVVVPDEAFAHDPTFEDALSLVGSLRKSAEKSGVAFNIKLTNTLEAENRTRDLPASEKMVYMSGRPLHVISIQLAAALQEAFDGDLDISFSAGVDARNIVDVLCCGLTPVTVCSDLLKPGGYGRLHQYIEEIRNGCAQQGLDTLDELIRARSAGEGGDPRQAALKNLVSYADSVLAEPGYRKLFFPWESIKTDRNLTVFDCTSAPCIPSCPAGQAIPAYMRHVAAGEDSEAFRVIMETNPFPGVQGKVCHAPCRHKCTRINLDRPLAIREIKRFASDHGRKRFQPAASTPERGRVAIIGGGPSGLSCAYFLATAGYAVDVFESKPFVGGLAADAIPEFRLDQASLQQDIDLIRSLGVKLHTGSEVDKERFRELQDRFDAVYIAVGARKAMMLGIEGEDAAGVIDHLSFLSRVRQGDPPELGNRVAVVGAGSAAMDAARTAKRLVGASGEVTILYRRTRREMPAEEEEIEAAEAEGVAVVELTAPERIITENNRVTAVACARMKLGDADESGRRRPVRIDDTLMHFHTDTIIPAIGQRIVLDFLPQGALELDPLTGRTQLERVFAGGDAVRGASTLIEAIGDGRRAAGNIITYREGPENDENIRKTQIDGFADYQKRLAHRDFGLTEDTFFNRNAVGFELATVTLPAPLARKEAARCLSCDRFCAVCTTVCPNRANICYPTDSMTLPLQSIVLKNDRIEIKQKGKLAVTEAFQILNIGDFCNECGNCTTFCPTDGAPYRTKPRFCISRAAFEQEENAYFLTGDVLMARRAGIRSVLKAAAGKLEYSTPAARVSLDSETLAVGQVSVHAGNLQEIDLEQAAEMTVLLRSLQGFYLFQ